MRFRDCSDRRVSAKRRAALAPGSARDFNVNRYGIFVPRDSRIEREIGFDGSWPRGKSRFRLARLLGHDEIAAIIRKLYADRTEFSG